MIVLKAFLFVIAYVIYRMPFFVHQIFAWFIALVWFDILRIRRQDAIKNVQRVFPEKSTKEATKMARTSLYHMGLTLTEFFSMPFLKKKDFDQMYEVVGKEHLDAAVAQNKGVFGLSVHLGNGDLGTAALASWGYPMNIISKVFKSKWLNDIWFSSRRAHGVKFIPPRKSSYEILKALKAKDVVVFVLDQYTGPPNGILTTFFGKETGTAMGLALFAQRANVPVVPIYTYRIGKLKHRIIIKPAIPFEEKASKEETIQHMTQQYVHVTEEAILEKPEQWMWVHRRYKMGFEGQKPFD